ncbi:hypothetical protein KUF71_014854 [Frankliniella fusca]|uniref:Uncharacterized protein n=1 Tax=Frankliniella fusca TaxID=407009 RepID=A0AAE1I3Q5_9NEOP|nr:hypothetical protein KUF71_014854 [Frankliniella fusca]
MKITAKIPPNLTVFSAIFSNGLGREEEYLFSFEFNGLGREEEYLFSFEFNGLGREEEYLFSFELYDALNSLPPRLHLLGPKKSDREKTILLRSAELVQAVIFSNGLGREEEYLFSFELYDALNSLPPRLHLLGPKKSDREKTILLRSAELVQAGR